MPDKRKCLRPGVGAKASILTRFIHPRIEDADKQHRSEVCLVSREERNINRKQQTCFTFTLINDDSGIVYHAVKTHFKILKEGKKEELFDPPGPNDDEEEQRGGPFKEPKIKWRKSKAKQLLYEAIIDGAVPLEAKDENGNVRMPVEDIYLLHQEFALYSFEKFPNRLQALREKIKDLDSRAEEDYLAFENYKQNHKPSLFSHKGYIQWQGSSAQELLLEDLDGYLEDPSKKPKDLWMSREEYRNEFPLDAFRDKIKQEIRTAKYLRTLKARQEGEKT
jgi:hypothetical protein